MRRCVLYTLLLTMTLIAAVLPLSGHVREASAHPLGNFTINHYSQLTFAGDGVTVFYVLDMAEIPTFEVLRRYDIEGDGILSDADKALYYEEMVPALVEYIELTVAGERVPLKPQRHSIELIIGDLGLPVLRVEIELAGDLPSGWEGAAGSYHDRTYEGRQGWREVVVRGGPGVEVVDSTAPEHDLSNALRNYPEEMIGSPIYDTAVTFRLKPGDGTVADDEPAVAGGPGGGGFAAGRLAGAITDDRLTPGMLALAIVVAVIWGAGHALTPGHGKAIVAAYLIGTRGTARHAALLGLTVTLTHTAGVFALALVTLTLSRFILPEDLYPWISVASGVLVVAIGATLLYSRWKQRRNPSVMNYLEHSHGGSTHTHAVPGRNGVTIRGLLALGVSGGLVPCPSALVLLLGAISVHRIELGIALVLAFSVGLAGVLTGIGLLIVYARWVVRRFSFEARVPAYLPVASALVISVAGLVILIDSLGQAGVI